MNLKITDLMRNILSYEKKDLKILLLIGNINKF